jgi:hypothetical protein
MNKLLILLLTPIICWSQEVGVQDYITALDDVTAFKEKFFKAYPLNSEIEPQAITLVEYDYILYQTISIDVPYILISDEAISIGMSNALALSLKAEFLDYFEENCEAKVDYKPEIGQFTKWHCDGVSLSMIKEKQITMLYIKKE